MCRIVRNSSQITQQLEDKGANIFIGDDVHFDSLQFIYSGDTLPPHPAIGNYPLYHQSVFLRMFLMVG